MKQYFPVRPEPVEGYVSWFDKLTTNGCIKQMDKSMKCLICKHGEMENGFTTVTLEKNASTIIFKHVPAHVCDNCGEQYVDSHITAELLKKAQEIVKNGVEVDIREYQSAA